MKVRIGDLVEFKDLYGKPEKGLVMGTEKNWWVIKDHVDVNSAIIPVENITKVTLREKLKNWWKWLDC